MASNETVGDHLGLGFPASKSIRDASFVYKTPALWREVIAAYATKKRAREVTDTGNRWGGGRQWASFTLRKGQLRWYHRQASGWASLAPVNRDGEAAAYKMVLEILPFSFHLCIKVSEAPCPHAIVSDTKLKCPK